MFLISTHKLNASITEFRNKPPRVIYKENKLYVTLFSDLCDTNHSLLVNIKGSENVSLSANWSRRKDGWRTMALSLPFANSQIHPSSNYSIDLNYICQKKC